MRGLSATGKDEFCNCGIAKEDNEHFFLYCSLFLFHGLRQDLLGQLFYVLNKAKEGYSFTSMPGGPYDAGARNLTLNQCFRSANYYKK